MSFGNFLFLFFCNFIGWLNVKIISNERLKISKKKKGGGEETENWALFHSFLPFEI